MQAFGGTVEIAFGGAYGAPDELTGVVVGAVESATRTADVASQQLAHPDLVVALGRAVARGCRVRAFVERDYLRERQPLIDPFAAAGDREPNRQALLAMLRAGVDVRIDTTGATMHSNLVVVDAGDPMGRLVITSANLDVEGLDQHANSAAVVAGGAIVADAGREFGALWRGRGGDAEDSVAQSAAGGRVELLFGPGVDIEARLVDEIRRARASVRLIMFTFSNASRLAGELAAAADRGVEVDGVVDHDSAGATWSPLTDLIGRGAVLNSITLPNDARMHHKIIMIDDRLVALGTYNLSRSARKNHEVMLLLTEATGVPGATADRPMADVVTGIRAEMTRLRLYPTM